MKLLLLMQIFYWMCKISQVVSFCCYYNALFLYFLKGPRGSSNLQKFALATQITAGDGLKASVGHTIHTKYEKNYPSTPKNYLAHPPNQNLTNKFPIFSLL